jgi:hypothetical protein
MKPNPPVEAYFVSGNSSTKSAFVGSYPSDTPGALFSVFNTTPTLTVLLNGLKQGRIPFIFSRRKGGSGVPVEIDLSVAETDAHGERTRRPGEVGRKWTDCALQLMRGQ